MHYELASHFCLPLVSGTIASQVVEEFSFFPLMSLSCAQGDFGRLVQSYISVLKLEKLELVNLGLGWPAL